MDHYYATRRTRWAGLAVRKMSAIRSSSTTRYPTTARPNQIVATAGACVGFLIINTLHLCMIFGGRNVFGDSYNLMFYSVSMLIGGFLSDYFNSWILFLVAVETSSVLTVILSVSAGVSDVRVLFMYLSFDVTAWFAAAKCIKKSTIPPSQQRLWWTLLTACSSTNIPWMFQLIISGFGQFWDFVKLSIPILAVVGYIIYKQPLATRNDQRICEVSTKQLHWVYFVKSYTFWIIVVLNTLLLATKWVGAATILPKDEGEVEDILWTKMVGGESGIVVIGAFSAWLMQTGKLTRRETLLHAILFILALGILIVLDRGLRSNTYLLVEFFVAFLSDGLMLLINWKLVEIIPETMSGRALGCATASLSGIILIRMGIESIYGWISLYMYHPLTVSLIHFTCISIATIVTVALLK